jgi:nicotinate phosphoribosyltransferase
LHQYLPHNGLLTDFYQLTMAQAYFDHQRHDIDAVFQLTFRKNPFGGNWTIAAGIDDAVSFIQDFRFDAESLEFLKTCTQEGARLFSDDFLQFLANINITVDVFGVRNGEIVFPHEPIIRIEGPLLVCQLLETPLLNIINFQSLIATKAARIVMAANQKPIIDFGLRRAQGFDGAISASKAAYLGGVTATSNVWASKALGIPTAGTQAHSFIMSYEKEADAFRAFADSFENHCVLLVDTYDVQQGINNAITTFRTMKNAQNLGIRIDSGNLLDLSRVARCMLDKSGFHRARIIASGDLDEYEIARLEAAHAPIDSYGVGTKLITAYDEPSLGGVYKLVSMKEHGRRRDTYKTSASPFKATKPGTKTINRYCNNSIFVFDHVFDANLIQPDNVSTQAFTQQVSLHQCLMKNGASINPRQSLSEARDYARCAIASLPLAQKGLSKAPKPYPVYFDNEESSESTVID